MIQIYSAENKDYDHNGDMTLLPEECSVHVVLNGEWTATLEHPIDDEGRWKYINDNAVVKMPSFNGEQLFRIKNKEKRDSGVSAELTPIFLDAKEDCFLLDVRPTEKNGQDALDIMTAPNKMYSAKSDIKKLSTAYYQTKNLIEAINGNDENSFINRWGGEILYNNYQITIDDHVGGDYGVQGTINGVKAQLRAQSSIAKKQTVRAVLFEDLDPDSPTFGAMCLGTLGFEIASERTADGRDWKWSTFGTGQGFFADFIVAGTMLADRIKGGTLELGGAGNGNGVAKVLNADGNEIVRLDKDGVYAKGKYVCANTDGSQTATLSNGNLTFKTESYEVVIRAGAIGGLTGLMIYPEQGAVRTKFLSIGDKLSARFDNISLLASGKTTIGGASLEVQRDGKGYFGKTGKAVFSDGTYLEYVNGFLVGGNTKEGGF